MDTYWILIPIGVIVIAGVIGLLFSKQKANELALLAGELQLSFEPDEDHELPQRFKFLDGFDEESDRYAFNVISGQYLGREVLAFDYHYETTAHGNDGRAESTDHESSVVILLLPAEFSRLTIGSENIMDKMEEAFGGADINFESAEFSKAFRVRSPDKKFAYDFCNARMMEYLLANQGIELEVEGEAIAMQFSGCLTAEVVEFNLQRLCEIRTRMPEYLFNSK